MRQQIALAIQLIRESAMALLHMPLLCFLPLLQIVCYGGITCIWMIYCLYLVTAGEKTVVTDSLTGLSYITYAYSSSAQYAIVFLLFAWLWSVGWLASLGQITAGHAIVTWYFAPARYEITSWQLFSSFLLTLRYHMGTAAFGSLLLACIRLLRIALEYVKYHVMKAMPSTNSTTTAAAASSTSCYCVLSCLRCSSNCLLRFVFCLLSCWLIFFERCIQFLNKHAYIQVAIFGTSFVPSAFNGFYLIMRNLGRLAAVNLVGDFVVFIGKLSISLSAAAIGYLYLITYKRDELHGFVLPTLMIGFLAYVTATMFLNSLSATAAALLQACILDEQYHVISSIEARRRERLAAKLAKKAAATMTTTSNSEAEEEEVMEEPLVAEEQQAKASERQALRQAIISQCEEWKVLSAKDYAETEQSLVDQTEEMITLRYHEIPLIPATVSNSNSNNNNKKKMRPSPLYAYYSSSSNTNGSSNVDDEESKEGGSSTSTSIPPPPPVRPPRTLPPPPINSNGNSNSSNSDWVNPGARNNRYAANHKK